PPPEARTSALLWDGDEDLGGASEQILFNGSPLTDGLNPANNVHNSTINSLGSSSAWGMDLDSYDVSSLVSEGDTLATLQVDTGPDLVILNNVILQAKTNVIAGSVFEDVNYGGGPGRDLATATAAAPSFTTRRPGAVVELYDATGVFLRSTTTNANGDYGFSGLPDGDYQVRVVNGSVQSSRPGGASGELAVQTFRKDASVAVPAPVTGEVGGASPALEDAPANGSSANLSTLTAQSVAPVSIVSAVTKAAVDFGYNFDTVVNTNNAGQGSLAQFIVNASALGNANLAQAGLAAGVEHSLFMIPSASDPLGRAADPNFDAGRGVARIGVTSLLPALTDADTTIDGSTQTTLIGDTNTALLGTGGTVGTGADNVPGTGDETVLSQVAGPEIEIVDDGGLDIGLYLQASDQTVRAVAIYGFGTDAGGNGHANVIVGDNSALTGHLIEDCVLGSAAHVFADPGAGVRTIGDNVFVQQADNGVLRNSLLGFAEGTGARSLFNTTGWQLLGNEVRSNSVFGYDRGDGIAFQLANSGSYTVDGNLVVDSGAVGIETFGAAGNITITNNTVTGSGTGIGVAENPGLRLYGTGNTIVNNVITGNVGAGILVAESSSGNLISRNSIDGNGTTTGQLGIDLLTSSDDPNLGTAPFVSPNDGAGDADSGGNGLQNYPQLSSVVSSGGSLSLAGTLTSAAATTYTLEFFASPVASASGFGEGARFIGSDTVTTNGAGTVLFNTVLPVSVPVGQSVSATAISPGNDTSEFSASAPVQSNLAIFKRAFFVDGTPIPNGSTLPDGVPFYFLLYVNNRDGARTDISLQDVLDPAIAYDAGTLRLDNSVAACAAATCTPAEEDGVFAAVLGTAALTDAVDADAASYTAGTRTVDVGNQNAGNAQVDIAANRVYALLLRARLQ
ncbi:MAG: right-handed parallel beta-helix repeat-containing protein, partial [Pseudomonadota bacterium]